MVLRRAIRLVAALGLVAPVWAAVVPAAAGAERSRDPATAPVDAAFPAAMAALPDGGLRYGERLTGRVREIDADGRLLPEAVATVTVSTEGQRGLLGLAVDGRDRTFATWTRPDGRIVVGQVAPGPTRLVWAGPHSSRLANGGRLAFGPEGGLVVGIGDLQRRARVDDPERPNGKLLRLEPDGPPDQEPAVISSGWSNPFAFTFTPSGALWVADNTGGTGSERLARGDRRGRPTRVTDLPGTRAPSGLAALDDDHLVLCGYVSRRLDEYRIDGGGAATRIRPPLARDCAIGVTTLADGTLAYADETTIRFVTR